MKRNLRTVAVAMIAVFALAASAVAATTAITVRSAGRESVAPPPKPRCTGNTCITKSVTPDGDQMTITVTKLAGEKVVTTQVIVDKQTGGVTTITVVTVHGKVVSKKTALAVLKKTVSKKKVKHHHK